jgi:hypothetical protein
MDAWNKNKWYDIISEVLPFKITDTDNAIFFIKPPLPIEEETQAETTRNVVTVGRNQNLINNISNYAYHKVTKGTTL